MDNNKVKEIKIEIGITIYDLFFYNRLMRCTPYNTIFRAFNFNLPTANFVPQYEKG